MVLIAAGYAGKNIRADICPNAFRIFYSSRFWCEVMIWHGSAMKTKRQKILLGALGLALAVFLGDRVYRGMNPGGPSQAEASEIADSTSVVPDQLAGLSREDTASIGAARPENELAKRFEAAKAAHFPQLEEVTDIFRPSHAWAGPAPQTETPLDSDEIRADEFAQDHKLEAMVVSSGSGIVIVSGQCVRIGQELDGFKLVSVGSDSAVFADGAARATLRLAETEGGLNPGR